MWRLFKATSSIYNTSKTVTIGHETTVKFFKQETINTPHEEKKK